MSKTSTSIVMANPSRLQRVSADVLNGANGTLCSQQYARLCRGVTEDISLQNAVEGVWHKLFMIHGSSASPYIIGVGKTTRIVWCNCPDARAPHDYTCKHICWFVCILLGLTDLEILTQCILPEDVVSNLNLANVLATRPSPVTLRSAPLSTTVFLDGFGGHAPVAGAECCVCYEDLGSEDESKCVHCPGCCNHFHSLCIMQWLAQGQDSCPLCRHH